MSYDKIDNLKVRKSKSTKKKPTNAFIGLNSNTVYSYWDHKS